jgi:hypothetical protein
MEFEVFGLLGEEALGLVGEVLATLDGFFAGQVEAGLAGERSQNSEPAGGSLIKGLQSFADVGVSV